MSVYVVIHTWKLLGLDQPMRFTFRSLGEPKYVKILNAGHHFLNSCEAIPHHQTAVRTVVCGP
jgi:hypothetical protein